MSIAIRGANLAVMTPPHPAYLTFPYTSTSAGHDGRIVDRDNNDTQPFGLLTSYNVPAFGPYPPPTPMGGNSGVYAVAQIALTGAASDSLAGWEFGWVQFITCRVVDVSYRSGTPSAGGIFAQLYPGGQATVLLDRDAGSGAPPTPWYSSNPASLKRNLAGFQPFQTTEFGDSPDQAIMTQRLNRSRAPALVNVLSSLWARFDFTTVLAFRAPGASVAPLKHFTWRVDWRATFTPPPGPSHLASAPWTVTPQSAQVSIGPVSDGAPAASGIAQMFQSGAFPAYNPAVGPWRLSFV